ncbi:MAG: Gfo/Idh/MocA family protein [Phycisphaerae bacterium]
MISFGIIGIGGYARQLIKSIEEVSETAGCKLVAAAVRSPAKYAEEIERLKESGVEIFTSTEEMLDGCRERCDAIFIPTGINTHMPVTLATAEKGYHIHLEKPAAGTVQEVDAMIEAVRSAGVLCLVGFQAQHGDDVLFVKDRIVSGRLGKVKTMSCEGGWPRPASYYSRNSWAGKLRIGETWVLDGPAMNAMAHQINNMLYFASPQVGGYAEPASVRAELYAVDGLESHDTAAIEIKTTEGPTLYFLGSHRTEESFDPAITIHAEKGTVRWQLHAGVTITYSDGSEESHPGRTDQKEKMVANFTAAIRDNDPSKLGCGLEDSRNMVLVLNGAHESSARIYPITAEHTRRRPAEKEGDHFTVVEHLDEYIHQAAKLPGLFSDLADAPPWAKATEAFDMSGYETFPVRFAQS